MVIALKKEVTKKTKIFIISAVVIAVTVTALFACAAAGDKEEVTYRETYVKYGSLSVGVTESGAVDIGTVEQTFDLDMSALQRADTGEDSGSGAGGNSGFGMAGGMGGSLGGMNMFDQIFNMAGGSTAQSGQDSTLTIAEVCVSVGQQISEGDVLFQLEEESVLELTGQMQSDVEKAKADLEAVYAEQELSKQTAQYTYDLSMAYGEYAQTEYDSSIADLQKNVSDAEKQLAQAQSSLTDYREQLAEMTEMYEEALARLQDCQWGLESYDKMDNTYAYVCAFEAVQSAQSTADSLEQKKECLESNVEQAEKNVETANKSLNTAKRNLEKGMLTAEETYDLRKLAYNTAQETYNIALSYLEKEASAQELTYAESEEKWNEYSSHVDGTTIRSKYDGVITGIELEAGDSIGTGTVLVTLYDMDEVSMTVTLDEDDMTDVAPGSEAVIYFTAYPDDSFRGTVTEIADAQTDSSGNVTYDVTVTIEGDVSGLFQGMTGEITFITEETVDVLYVSGRAIITEGENTYVKVRDEKGNIKKIQVTCGFTDGTYTEITGGLSEGDVVLIESMVTK